MSELIGRLGQILTGAAPRDAARSADTTVARDAAPSLASDALSVGGTHRIEGQASIVNSVFHFDAQHPQVQALAERLGWNRPGMETTLLNDGTFLHFSADGWKTSQDVPLQYLHDNRQGFLLKDLPDGTPIQYAIHAKLGLSQDQFYSLTDRQDAWLNQWGDGAQTQTEINR